MKSPADHVFINRHIVHVSKLKERVISAICGETLTGGLKLFNLPDDQVCQKCKEKV